MVNLEGQESYLLLSGNIKTVTRAFAQKLQGRVEKYLSLIEALTAEANTREILPSNAISCELGLVDINEVRTAIQNDVDTVKVYDLHSNYVEMEVEAVLKSIRETADTATTIISGLNALQYSEEESPADTLAIFNDYLNSTGADAAATTASTRDYIKSLILNREMAAADKVSSLIYTICHRDTDYTDDTIDDQALLPMTDVGSGSPVGAFLDNLNLDFSNIWSGIYSILNLNIHMALTCQIAVSKLIYAGYSKIKNWIQDHVTQGSWITTKDKYEELYFDNGALKFTYNFNAAQVLPLLARWDERGTHFLKFHVPGGIVYFTKPYYDTNTYTYHGDAYFKPMISDVSSFITKRRMTGIQWGLPGYGMFTSVVPVSLNDLATVWYNWGLQFSSNTTPFDVNDTTYQADVTYSCLITSLGLFYMFLKACSAVPGTWSIANVMNYNSGITLDAIGDQMISDLGITGPVRPNYDALATVNDYVNILNRDIDVSTNAALSNSFSRLIAVALMNTNSDEDIKGYWEWTNKAGAGAYHLVTNTELRDQFISGVTTAATVAVIAIATFVIAKKYIKLLRAKTIAQGQADLYLFNEVASGDATPEKWINYLRLTRRANRLAILAGLPVTVASTVSSVISNGISKVKDVLGFGSEDTSTVSEVLHSIQGDDEVSLSKVYSAVDGLSSKLDRLRQLIDGNNFE